MYRSFLLVVVFLVLLLTFSAATATVPSPVYSTCTEYIGNWIGCADADILWCPAGDLSLISFHVNVRDEFDNPMAGCAVRLDYPVVGDPQDELNPSSIFFCGNETATGVTDLEGDVYFHISGGGCGRFIMTYTVTAMCSDPPVQLCTGSRQMCAKSPDFNGDGTVNFFDTFKYLPQLVAGQGYCGDLNCDGAVTFFDTFRYLPHLSGTHTCPGSTANIGPLGDCP